ncbi:MAG TPA: hypothetical protein VMI75_01585 [Polyangiaceae bacterium]|nr:hypothetical protein [Polyangiaceae bacterium]
MTEGVSIQVPADFQKRVIYFVSELLNRKWRVRDAVLEGMKRTNASYGEGVEFRVSADAMERLIAYFEGAVEQWQEQREAGAEAVGSGLYAEVVSQDEYDDRTRKP